jgi:uncharacterized protein YgiM (DUF1202 family)
MQGTRLTVLGDRDGWVKIVMPANEKSWVSAEFIQKGGEDIGTLTGDGVNVRTDPAASGQILGQLPLGYQVKIVEERTGWYRIRPLPGTVGWVSAGFIRIVSGAPLTSVPAAAPGTTPVGTGALGPATPSETGAPSEAAAAPAAPSESAKQFEEAEAIYKAEVSKPDITTWDVPKLTTLYEALAKSPDRNIRFKAENRLSQVNLYKNIQERIVEGQKVDAQAQEKIKEIDETFRRMIEETRRAMVAPGYVAEGVIRRLAIPYLPPATHKIQGERRILFLLYSPDLDLSPYEGQKVGILGTLTRVTAVRVLEE